MAEINDELNISWFLFKDKFNDLSEYYKNNSNAFIINEPTSLEKPLNLKDFFKRKNVLIKNVKAIKVFQSGLNNMKTNSLSYNIFGEKDLCSKNFIKDFSFLYECTNIERLELDNQTRLLELDVSKFKKLNYLSVDSCVNLSRIYFLENMLYDEKGHFQNIFLDVHNCENLCSEDLYKFVKIVANNNQFAGSKIIFNESTFINLIKNHPELKKDFASNNSYERFCIGSQLRAYQMPLDVYFKEKELINKIIKQIDIKKEDAVETKVKKVYDWFLQKIKYDNEEWDSFTDSKGPKNDLRASIGYYVLLNKRGICGGISEAMATVLKELDIEAKSILIKLNAEHPHGIVRFKDGEHWYFCDPTADRYPYLEKEEYNKLMDYLKLKLQNNSNKKICQIYSTFLNNFINEKIGLTNYFQFYKTLEEEKDDGIAFFSYDEDATKNSPSILAKYIKDEELKPWINQITAKEFFSILQFCEFIRTEAKIKKEDSVSIRDKKLKQYLSDHNLTINSKSYDIQINVFKDIVDKKREDLFRVFYFIQEYIYKSNKANFPINELLSEELGLNSSKTKNLEGKEK